MGRVYMKGRTRTPKGVAAAQPFTPNLPAGLTLQYDTTFENLAATPGSTPGGLEWNEFMAGGASVVNTPGAPYSARSFQMAFPAGDTGGSGGPALLVGTLGNMWAKVYYSVAFRLSTNYVSHANEEKFWYPQIINSGGTIVDSWNFALMPAWNPTDATTRWRYRNWIFNSVNSLFESNSVEYVSAPFITKGDWVTLEMYCVMNAPNTSNGSVKTWINGVPQMDLNNVRFHNTGAEAFFSGVYFESVRGGGPDAGSAVPAGGQTRWFNRLAVHTSSSRT